MSYKVGVIIEKDENGYYAYCPKLEGCQSQGDMFEEVVSNIKEAIELYFETLSQEERKMYSNQEVYTTSIEVNIT